MTILQIITLAALLLAPILVSWKLMPGYPELKEGPRSYQGRIGTLIAIGYFGIAIGVLVPLLKEFGHKEPTALCIIVAYNLYCFGIYMTLRSKS